MPIIQTLFNPGMRNRHWALVSEVVGYEILPTAETTLAKVLTMGLEEFVPKFETIADAAMKEHALETNLMKMKSEWEAVSTMQL